MIDTSKTVLDVCCGSRMFYYQKYSSDEVFCDIREGTFNLGTYPTKDGMHNRQIKVQPDVICDFRRLPFRDGQFNLVIFDPPHLNQVGKNSWLNKKYGHLGKDWSADIKQGFREAMRVLRPSGTLIFKWSDIQIPVKEVLKTIEYEPLLGDKRGQTRWLVFYKAVKIKPKRRKCRTSRKEIIEGWRNIIRNSF